MRKNYGITLLLLIMAVIGFSQSNSLSITIQDGNQIEKQVLVFDHHSDIENGIEKSNLPEDIKQKALNDFLENYEEGEAYNWNSTINGTSYSVSINNDEMLVIEDRDDRQFPMIYEGDKQQNVFIFGGNKAYLGLQYEAFDFRNDKRKDVRGITVVDVVEGEAAFNAGLQKGDVITKINDWETPSLSLFKDAVSQLEPRQEVSFTINRDGNEMILSSIAGVNEGNNMNFWNGDSFHFPMLELDLENMMEGLDLEKLEDLDLDFNFEEMMEPRPQLGVGIESHEEGVLIDRVEEGSAAEDAGLQSGDIIIKFDNQEIQTPQDLVEAVQSSEIGEKVKIQYLRNGKKKNATVTLKKSKVIYFFENEEG